MADQEVPGSVRIRTGDGNEWRFDAMEKAAEFYDCNRSNAVAFACDDVAQLVEAAHEVLARDDLTEQQRREMAETLSTRTTSFEVSVRVDANVQ
ncbi:uncharacterized protein NP_5336A [Natronomonas pharaonis DSM 2160]|uniref:DUF7692 domain-containing protein n=1 Tax=Natronomonas pharaonis (strain ATCC 35678 / DSM 2160 / CIP 103997 / JCM 8858 / NBRC 14720 / NCIMB 2260 / Gabara) TaxID=348780 RepID=A0A1U7EZM1_NATPD|nr:hypothetical protein [Natronomonas pharaonis]CAI50759.1 uncharacterized protein NP_5336A [Natronomonas pharaonis DSM 2160]